MDKQQGYITESAMRWFVGIVICIGILIGWGIAAVVLLWLK